MLKKFFIAGAFFLTMGVAASAQEVSSDIKPAAGDVTAEVQLSLTGTNNSTINLGLNQLRGRYFLSPTTAVRASFTLQTENEDLNDDFNRTSTFISLAPGIEKHFAGTDRLSPYVGGEISISKLFANEENPYGEVEGAWSSGGNSNSISNRNYFALGLRAVAGADFYFAKHVYLGVEFGLGFQYEKEGDVKIKPNSGPNTTIDGERGTFRFGPNVNSGLRLGFVF
ncbi:hypothetical protein [Rufibacter immobilis]|uniref:hypothetical protein n=1 Tax=Rufibacter immobilis TaxID=1348778 RepID=UPI0035E84A7F